MEASYNFSYSGEMSPAFLIVWLAVMVFFIYCGWKLFVKAGQPGWAVLIPIYNAYVMLKIVGKPGWWLLLFLIPFVNFIVAIIVTHNLSLRFGKGTGYTLGLLFLGFIFMPMLALGSAKYTPAS
jgi:hypothetical protein